SRGCPRANGMARRQMRVACWQILLLSGGVVLAQPAQLTTRAVKTAEEIGEIDEPVAFWLETCLGDWDPATHMSRSERKTTCHSVSEERRNFLLKDPASFTIGPRPRISPIRSCAATRSKCPDRIALWVVTRPASERPTAYRPRKLSCKNGGSLWRVRSDGV